MKTHKQYTPEHVLKSNLCAGCGLCQSLAGKDKIKVDFDDSGFIRPTVISSLNSSELDIFNKTCPALRINHENDTQIKDVIWGNYYTLATGYAKNNETRHRSSSGGIISALLIYLIDKKLVDSVIHIGVSDSNPLINEIKISRTADEVLRNSGSRYSPSSPLINIDEMIEPNTIYAFVGKPCDVAALRMYSKYNDKIHSQIKYMFSFLCAGVPSLNGTRKILNHFNVMEDNVKSFRYRGEGWPGYTKIETKTNKTYTMKYDDSWGKILNRHLQTRCKICIDGIGEFADIACGDAWYGNESGYPKFEEQEGRSVLISRTINGEQLIVNAIKDRYITLDNNILTSDLEKMQPYQLDRRRTLLSKITSMKVLGRQTPKYSTYILINSAKQSPKMKLIKTFLGTTRRILDKKL